MKESVVSIVNEIIASKKKKIKINKFQIENMRINSIIIKNKIEIEQEEKEENVTLNKNIKFFFEINKSLLMKNEIIDFGVEIEIIPFGQPKFENESKIIEYKNEEELKKKRYIQKNGNIFILLKGKKI